MNLLNNPLSYGDEIIDENDFFNDLVNELKIILKHNIIHNPWFSKYFTNFEELDIGGKMFTYCPQRLLNVFLMNLFWDKAPF